MALTAKTAGQATYAANANGRPLQVNIQLLRFVATLTIVLCHVIPHYTAAGGSGFTSLFRYLPLAGNLGVDVFFVISGYILWVTTTRHSGMMVCGRFLYRRATRVYLGYWPFLLLLVGMRTWYAVPLPAGVDWWGSVLLTQNESRLLLLPVAWTLSYEIYFYLVFAALLCLPPAWRRRGLWVWLALFVLAMFWLWLVFNGYWQHNAALILRACSFVLSSYCADFIGGCLLASYLERGGSLSLPCSVAALVVPLAVIGYCSMTDGSGASVLDYPYRRAALYGVAAMALVAGVVQLERAGQVLWPRLSLLLGNMTYSTYLSHTILLEWFYHLGWRTAVKAGNHSPLLFVCLALLAVLAYSIIHYRCIETPLMNLSRAVAARWFERRPAGSST